MVLVIATTLASYGLGWLIGLPWLVPFLNAAYPWWRMATELRRGEVRRAVSVMLLWALTMGVVSTSMVAMGWSRTRSGSDLFLRASYRAEMTSWVRTGIGAESQPLVFIPRHLGYAAVFARRHSRRAGCSRCPWARCSSINGRVRRRHGRDELAFGRVRDSRLASVGGDSHHRVRDHRRRTLRSVLSRVMKFLVRASQPVALAADRRGAPRPRRRAQMGARAGLAADSQGVAGW
jgi:hypothetical protein